MNEARGAEGVGKSNTVGDNKMKSLSRAIREAQELKARHKYHGQIAIRKYQLSPRKLSFHFAKNASVGDKGGAAYGDPYEVIAIV